TAAVVASGWDPVVGEPSRLAARLGELLAEGFRVVVAGDGRGSAARVAASLSDEGLALPLVEDGEVDLTRPGGHVVVESLERGFSLPNVKLAVLAENDVTGRRRAHRRPRP